MNICSKFAAVAAFAAVSCPGSFASTESMSLAQQAANFVNPAYPLKSSLEEVYIPDGSVANFSSNGLVGLTIRHMQGKNDIPNPNGYTHSGFLFWANPAMLVQKLSELMHTEGSHLHTNQQYGAEMIYDIQEYYPHLDEFGSSDYRVFLAESDGSAGEVLRGIYPHVHIHPFEQSIAEYNGRVYFRPCLKTIAQNATMETVLKYVGTPYESPFTLGSMLKAIHDKNKVEKQNRLFCSEFVAVIYKELGYLPSDLVADNTIPEEFSKAAGDYDLLKDFCGDDVKLKNLHKLNSCCAC